jgi:hypothetical protein
MSLSHSQHGAPIFYSGRSSIIDALDLITPREAERLYGVTRVALARTRKLGMNPPVFEVLGCVLYRRSDIADTAMRTVH